MSRIFNNKKLKVFRQNLRNEMPKAEVILWKYLREKQIETCKFRRQHSVGRYILDFYCPKLKIAIELDGESHYCDESKRSYDTMRDTYLKTLGITTLRFLNTDIYQNLSGVLEDIRLKVIESFNSYPSHPPLTKGR